MTDLKDSLGFSPEKYLVYGFGLVIACGTVLLMLPAATRQGIGPVDALFTATSAVCVTGLIVKNTAVAFTPLGQAIILLLIQIGGLGYMSCASLILLFMGKRIKLTNKLLIRETLNFYSLESIGRFLKQIVIFALAMEAAGTLALTLCFLRRQPWDEALWSGLFHAVSAFNNAGFCLLGNSFNDFRHDWPLNLAVMPLVIIGGLGFVVVLDLYNNRCQKPGKLAQHSLVVITASAILITVGALLILVLEKGGAAGTLLPATFASVTARTAGFTTIDYQSLKPATILATMLLMFVGASPGGTGGGIKTTTAMVTILFLWTSLRRKQDSVLYKRRLSEACVQKGLIIFALAIISIGLSGLLLLCLENSDFTATMFETISAFGTVGLSLGDGTGLSLAASFSPAGKMLVALTMLVGRIGPLIFFSAFFPKKQDVLRFPEGRILLG